MTDAASGETKIIRLPTPLRFSSSPMRALLAFDKFKDALTARQACELAARALRDRHPDWQLDLCPLADGGEGFAEILTHAAGGHMLTAQVAANQQQQTPATNDEMAIAVWRAAELQKQTDKNYARRLRQQATQAAQANAPKAPKVGGRYKR